MAGGTPLEPEVDEAMLAKMVPGRTCGSCSMCCKVFPVPWVENKPRGQWCKHCRPGRGCGIWETRPTGCKAFHCQWFFNPALGPEWRPDVAKFVLNLSADRFWLEIIADHAQPNAWRREPYFSVIRALADSRIEKNLGVLLNVLDRWFIVTPTEEIDISQFPRGSTFHLGKSIVNGRPTYNLEVTAPAA